jgi:antitoxin component YwqK of YwqJK toxin-antitoxin module
MKKIFLLLCFAFVLSLFNIQIQGQNVPKPLQSNFLIQEGIKWHDRQEFDSARFYFNQITRNDSLYATASYEIALGYYSVENYDSALYYIKKAVNGRETNIREQARTLMGSIFDDAGMPDSALACYEEALKLLPYSSKLLYDLGVTHYKLGHLELAEQYLIQAIKLNPVYYRATIILGRVNEKMNRRVEALLCYYMASLINNNASIVRAVELYLGGESDIVPGIKEYVPTHPSFEKIEDYIDSKIAMNAKYKPIVKSTSAFARQGDLLFKYLQFDPKSDNFYMNYYVRFFTSLRDRKLLETCMNLYFAEFDFPHVKKWIEKNSAKVKQFYTTVVGDIFNLAAKGFVNEAHYDGMFYVFSNGVLLEFGKYSDEKNKVKEEMWLFVEKDGLVSTTLNYEKGKPQGVMESFASDGSMTSEIPYINGVRAGTGKWYHDNGNPRIEAHYVNNKLDGKCIYFFYTGQKEKEENFVNGLEDGLTVNYFKNGAVKDSIFRSQGKQNGEYLEYYPNGNLSVKGKIINDFATGEVFYYYPDGQIRTQGTLVKNEYNGKWTTYYPNGAVESVVLYNDKGVLVDTSKNYNANGDITLISINSNNGKNAHRIYYRPDGSIYEKEEIKNNELVKVELFDNDNKSIEVINIGKGNTNVKRQNWMGNISSEGIFKAGKIDGRWVYRGLHGNIERISHFKNGDRNGTDTTFYANGQIKSIENFKDDQYNGYTTYFHISGNVEAEGYCVNDKKEGYWLYYDIFGKLTRKAYFTENEADQWQQYFYPNGNLDNEMYYNNFILKEIVQYDSTGTEYERVLLPDRECKIVLHYPNGSIKLEQNFIGGVSNGEGTLYFENGQKKYTVNEIMGETYGTLTSYNEDGKHRGTRSYLDGKLYGNSTVFYESEREESKYYNNLLYDTMKYYSFDNQLTEVFPFMDDHKHGWASYYVNGKLAYQLLYYKNEVIECFSPKNHQRIPVKNNETITTYFANGVKSAEMSFLNGYREGKMTKYYPNGKVKEEKSFVYGSPHGEEKTYNQQGVLVKKTNYYYGEHQKD